MSCESLPYVLTIHIAVTLRLSPRASDSWSILDNMADTYTNTMPYSNKQEGEQTHVRW